jgi:aspartyl-tRNA(Asn)/glutamyl-tRNA(Gln) amidotransferase subunit C
MALGPDEVKKIAHLARLAIDDAAIDGYAKNLSNILDMFAQMNSVDTAGIAPMAHSQDVSQRLRDDVVTEHNQREHFQKIAPHTEAGLYLVPKVIE